MPRATSIKTEAKKEKLGSSLLVTFLFSPRRKRCWQDGKRKEAAKMGGSFLMTFVASSGIIFDVNDRRDDRGMIRNENE